MQLFSSTDIGESRPAVSTRKAFQMTYERTQAVMATPNDQPILSVVYRFAALINIPSTAPITTARTVSCGTASPW